MNVEKPIETKNSNQALAILDQSRDKIAKILPQGAQVNRYMAILQSEVNKNPDLATCFPASLVGAMLHCARLGLEPGLLNKVYLIPFNNSKLNRKDCNVIVGFEGLCDLAMRTGKLSTIQAHLVYEKDHFEVMLGGESKLVHRPLFFSDRGPLVGVYAIAFGKDGSQQFEVMTKKEIDDIAKTSKSAYIWEKHYGEMARKTAIRRLCKHLEKTAELSQALQLENAADSDEGQNSSAILLEAGIEYETPLTVPQEDKFLQVRAVAERMLELMPNDAVLDCFARSREEVLAKFTTEALCHKAIAMMKEKK